MSRVTKGRRIGRREELLILCNAFCLCRRRRLSAITCRRAVGELPDMMSALEGVMEKRGGCVNFTLQISSKCRQGGADKKSENFANVIDGSSPVVCVCAPRLGAPLSLSVRSRFRGIKTSHIALATPPSSTYLRRRGTAERGRKERTRAMNHRSNMRLYSNSYNNGRNTGD